ncbi:hypothetical protein [Coleofasciculus sp. F4-SAH-05]|uniref:hypothetical protein n=1 Tax=Coleofasciculus sp. F4-SAH-05 TaxID=3069525 RepID=UPI0032F155B5
MSSVGKGLSFMASGQCPFGGKCIDPRNPSLCSVENNCINFRNKAERLAYDALPYAFFYWSEDGTFLLFREKWQLAFYLVDQPSPQKHGATWGKIPIKEIREFLLSSPVQNLLPVPALLKLNEAIDI